MPRWRDEEEDDEEQFPVLHPGDRVDHIRRMARGMQSDYGRLSRVVGAQYLFLAVIVAALLVFAPTLHLRLSRQMWWLILLYTLGGVTLVWGQNHRRRR